MMHPISFISDFEQQPGGYKIIRFGIINSGYARMITKIRETSGCFF